MTMQTSAKPIKSAGATIPRTRKRPLAHPSADVSTGISPAMSIAEPAREESIRARAYAIYESRGCVDGRALDDWLAAEGELAARREPARG